MNQAQKAQDHLAEIILHPLSCIHPTNVYTKAGPNAVFSQADPVP